MAQDTVKSDEAPKCHPGQGPGLRAPHECPKVCPMACRVVATTMKKTEDSTCSGEGSMVLSRRDRWC